MSMHGRWGVKETAMVIAAVNDSGLTAKQAVRFIRQIVSTRRRLADVMRELRSERRIGYT